jgi:hypothetical protein
MTSMLYTAAMNEKLNVPGEIVLGNQQYSWRMDWSVNGWLMVATLLSGCTDIIFRHATSQWPLGGRVAIVAAQFGFLFLWSRALGQWIRGMDEMHQRITTAAVLFAIGATFFVLMLWHRLEAAGLFAGLASRNPNATWDICTVAHGFLLMTLFYFLGFRFINRRYQ